MPIFGTKVCIGRVVYVADGKEAGKIATISEVIDQNRALIDGPGLDRQPYNFRNLQLTKLKLPLFHGARTRTVRKLWKEEDVDGKWKETAWAKRIQQRKVRAGLNDFERFKLAKLKQMRNRVLRGEYNKLKKSAKAQKGKGKK